MPIRDARKSSRRRVPNLVGVFSIAMVSLFSLSACGGGGGESDDADAPGGAPSSAQSQAASDLTDWELEHGIGPITEPVNLGEIDPALVAQGEEKFTLLCTACHKLDERYVAPPLRDVTSRRTPEFVMNMMLNPLEMTQRHPATKQLLAEYYTPMAPLGLTEQDARALLEYLRKAFADGPSGQ